MNKLYIIPFYILLFLTCRNNPAKSLFIGEITTINHIPSGSGIVLSTDSMYLVGDDAPYIFKMHQRSLKGRPISIMQYHGNSKRIAKPIKHDLESCLLADINGREHIIAFGSGGLSPYRDSMVIIPTADESGLFKISLDSLYNSMALASKSARNEINIEGSLLMDNRLILLNRGKNFIAIIPWNKMVSYILSRGNEPVPPVSIINIALPKVDGYPVGFSGACAMPGSQVLFTASVEKTTDYVSDGEVLAGLIGVVEITGNSNAQLIRLETLKDENGNLLPIKIESIDLESPGNNYPLNAIAVADNDDGKTMVMHITINK